MLQGLKRNTSSKYHHILPEPMVNSGAHDACILDVRFPCMKVLNVVPGEEIARPRRAVAPAPPVAPTPPAPALPPPSR